MAGHFEEAVTKYWPVVTGVAIAGWTVISSWFTGRRRDNDRADRETAANTASVDRETAAQLKQRNELINIAEEVSGKMLTRLQSEADRLAKRVSELEDEVRDLQRTHAAMLASKDAKITLLEGNLGQALAFVGSYERLLTENSIPHDQPHKPFWELSNHETRAVETKP